MGSILAYGKLVMGSRLVCCKLVMECTRASRGTLVMWCTRASHGTLVIRCMQASCSRLEMGCRASCRRPKTECKALHRPVMEYKAFCRLVMGSKLGCCIQVMENTLGTCKLVLGSK